MNAEVSKYFIALIPPEPLESDIMKIKEELAAKYQTRGALRSPAHITLHMPFEWKTIKEIKLTEILSAFRFEKPPEIELPGYSCFEPRVLFIDVKRNEQLINLQKELVFHVKSNLNIFNQYDDKRGFHPHLTIAFRDLKKDAFYQAWDSLKEKEFQGKFTASSFHLLRMNGNNWVKHREFSFS
jgi:2'-5' RNA ligase